MQNNHFESSHTLSAHNFENPETNLLNSSAKPFTPSNASAPRVREPSNQPSHLKLNKILLHSSVTQNHSPSTPPMINSPFLHRKFNQNLIGCLKYSPMAAPPKQHLKQLIHCFPGATKIWAPNSLPRETLILNRALLHIESRLMSSVI
ncbi:hypothetical protein O181_000092 [Austropuccinia psidii MF-1]|uniref:Uncharacterized protein n=1 Tax=Austropuccinia psidii MF-1 TaxID=1389203 RepID=A0A9Q3GBP0_9BASI|nr:hypothetical protein [Austropuccinia psidii MF-1]